MARWKDIVWRYRQVGHFRDLGNDRAPGLVCRPIELEAGKASFVLEIDHGKVIGDARFVATAEDTVLGDLQALADVADPENHWSLRQKRLRLPRRLQGTAVLLAAASGNNYFHWMTESLPRLHLLEKAGWKVGEVDCYLINELQQPFHQQSLALLGIKPSRLRRCAKTEVLQVGKLVVPVLAAPSGCCPGWALAFLRNRLLPSARPAPPQRLFISRRQAARRRIWNELELENALHELGFRTLYLETMPLMEQIANFASACLIVAPHGAGLSNLVFAPRHAALLELFAPAYVNECYRHIASLLGIRYSRLNGQPAGKINRLHLEREDFTVPVSEVLRWVEFILSENQARSVPLN